MSMFIFKRLKQWDDILIPFVQQFIVLGHESERSVSSVIKQIQDALESDPDESGLWLIMKELQPVGYLFAQVMPTEYQTSCILVHQSYINPRARFRHWKEMEEILFHFGEPAGANEIFFLTRRDPNAFIRLLKKGWNLDSFILRKKKSVPAFTRNGHVALDSETK